MKKIITVSVLIVISLILKNTCQKTFAIANPWKECGDDMNCASNVAGFNLPLRLNKYNIRAMKNMIEVKFPLSKSKTVILRKSDCSDGIINSEGIVDISGVYDIYPVNKTIHINGVSFFVRGNKNKYFVVNFAAETGYYSFYCKKGITKKDIKYLYKLLEEAEAPRNSFDETQNYTIEQLEDLRRVDEIVEPVYTQDCFPRTLEKKGVTKNCFEKANLGFDLECSSSEIKMIKEYYKKGQDKDPLNDGSGQFCAD